MDEQLKGKDSSNSSGDTQVQQKVAQLQHLEHEIQERTQILALMEASQKARIQV